jgi:DNA-binding GntR family transcriptional regulator
VTHAAAPRSSRLTAATLQESASSRVLLDLRDRISSGALTPGETLTQKALALEYGVSRMPVRDALRALAADGLVELRSASATVTPLTIPDLQELYELRESVEPLATRLAVARVGRAEIARMSRLLEAMEHAEEDPARWIALNAEFHAAVYSQAGRPRTIELVEHLRRLTDRYVYFHLDVVGDSGHLQQEHREILAAVQSGDAELAAERTKRHLVSSHDVVLRYLLDEERVDPES